PAPPTSPLFPYTTLFRSSLHQPFRKRAAVVAAGRADRRDLVAAPHQQHGLVADVAQERGAFRKVGERHALGEVGAGGGGWFGCQDRKSTRLNSSHVKISY